jgi:Tfp pilus assembly protein PilP
MRSILALVVCLFALGESVTAQQPQAPAQAPVAQKPADPAPVEAVPGVVRVSDHVSGYNSGGKRDPFLSLVAARRASSDRPLDLPTRQTGLATLPLVDAKVTGVLRLGGNFMAVIEGPDKQSFNARPKDRLLDAVIKSIDATGVVFMEQTEAGTPPREVKKAIRRGVEVNR